MRRLIGVLLAATVVLMIAYALVSSGPHVPDSSVLVLEVSGELGEAPPLDALQQFLAGGPALPTLVLQLDKAAADPRVEGVLLHLRPVQAGFAQLQELRDGLTRLRLAGKPVIALLELSSLNATREVYLASAADQIYVVPGFLGSFAGLSGNFMFLGGLFEKAGVTIEYERIGAFKSAPETFAERGMSQPARQNANELLDGLFAQIVAGVAEGRGLSPDQVRRLIDDAPSTGEEYVAAGLANGVADRSEVLELAGLGDTEELDLATYLQVDPRSLSLRDGPAIGLVFAQGIIVPGEGSRGSRDFAADRVARALESAAEDPDVRAIVLRVDSGGGSPLASDQLWRVIRRITEERPVVISMGNAAASGGYYLASAASAIVAQPGTITGSIGVFFMRPSFAKLYEKLDVHTEVMARGELSGMSGSSERFSAPERKRAQRVVESLYQDFLQRVSTGRELSNDEVDRLGRGRVWLGSAAYEHGLVDEMGSLHTAIERAKLEAGLDASVDSVRKIFPGPRGLSEQIRDLMSGELRGWLLRELLPLELRAPLLEASTRIGGDFAYLPSFWLELR
jgi:protease-4